MAQVITQQREQKSFPAKITKFVTADYQGRPYYHIELIDNQGLHLKGYAWVNEYRGIIVDKSITGRILAEFTPGTKEKALKIVSITQLENSSLLLGTTPF